MLRAAPSAAVAAGVLLLAPAALAARLPEWARAIADAAPPVPSGVPATETRVLRRDTRLAVQPDGSLRLRRRVALQVLSARAEGVQAAAFGVRPQMKVTTSRAWHLTPEQKAKKSHGFDAFDVTLDESFLTDRSTRLVAMEGTERGSLVFFEFEAVETPYTLDHVEWFAEAGPIASARFELEQPPGWSLRAAWLRHTGAEPAVSGQVRVWELRDLPAPVEEDLAEEPGDGAPILALAFAPPAGARVTPAVLPDWASLARWFESLAEGRDRVTPEIAAQADGAGPPAGDLLGRLRSSAHLVRDSVRYVAKEVGIGGYQPRPASETLATRYGDCKDKATLFRSILAARGVPSYAVLVSLGDPETVPEAVATPGVFNHMVVAVPLPAETFLPPTLGTAVAETGELGRLMFVDTTDEYTSFGSIAGPLAGQRGLVVAGARGRLVTLPGADPAAHRVERRLRGEILPDRSVRVRVESRYYGQPAASARADYRRSSQDRREAEEKRLRSIWAGARVSEYAVLYETPDGEFVESATVDLPRLAPQGPQAWVQVFPGAREELPTVPLGRRRSPVVYRYPRTLRVETAWSGVPAGVALPAPRAHDAPGGSVRTSFEREGTGVRGVWELRLADTRYDPAAFEEIRRLWSAAANAGAAVLDLSIRPAATGDPS